MKFKVKLKDSAVKFDSIIIENSTIDKYTPTFMGTGFNKYKLEILSVIPNYDDHNAKIYFEIRNKYIQKDEDNLTLVINDNKDYVYLLKNISKGVYATTISNAAFDKLIKFVDKNHTDLSVGFDFFIPGK